MKHTLNLIIFLVLFQLVDAQQNELKFHAIEAEYFGGAIMEHNSDIAHLITDFPSGLILCYNHKTYGYTEVEGRYNYPDWGYTFIYQDMKNPILGENYGLYGHFTFYFLNRTIRIGIGQGVAYNTNPYDPETNYNNSAYGTHLLSTTYGRFNLVKENIWKGLGAHAGFGVIHYSNANFKAPNNSTNTFYFSAGLNYTFNQINFPNYIPVGSWPSRNYSERIKYNIVFRTGVNEADVNGLGQYPFATFSLFADKRINYKSTFQVGVDFFFSRFLEELIKYRSIAFPGEGTSGEEDYRRIGVFIGHELRFDKLAFVSQLGYYVYYPYEFVSQYYDRLGLKRYFFEDKFFVGATVKAHWAKAEAVEFSIGVRI